MGEVGVIWGSIGNRNTIPWVGRRMLFAMGWYDKNQVSNQGEYTNPTESVKTEEIGMD